MKALRLHGVPLHPVLVHFPVAAWTAATGLLLLDHTGLVQDTTVLARHINAFGLVAGALAILAGLMELPVLPDHGTTRDAVAKHMLLACSAWFTYGVVWVLQMKSLEPAATAASLAGFLLLTAAGHAGARVVYHHGFPRPPDPR